MLTKADFLLEIQTEELPAKELERLGSALCAGITQRLIQIQLTFSAAQYYVTPRRLAVLVENLDLEQSSQVISKKGPAITAAYDHNGQPTAACLGFAQNCGVDHGALQVVTTATGTWLQYQQTLPKQATINLLPALIKTAITTLPIAKAMRWGQGNYSFVRPITGLLSLLGSTIVPVQLFGLDSQNYTVGLRFHRPQQIVINQPKQYLSFLQEQGKVIVDHALRKQMIVKQANALAQQVLGPDQQVVCAPALLDEVTGLVEWPIAICGSFAPKFLHLPDEVLIAVMQNHQRYFPIVNQSGKLQPHYIAIINLDPDNPETIINANNQVLRARLSDAAFFIEQDQQQTLENRVPTLHNISFQASLGSLYTKTERLQKIASYLAEVLHADATLVLRAAFLAKADLTTNIVGEFPELQGIIGKYYAQQEQEHQLVALALAEQYYPRYAKDQLPTTIISCIVGLADRLDTLIGLFGVNLAPSGEKDPYALRRAALGVIRIILEHQISLELSSCLEYIFTCYHGLLQQQTVAQVLNFIQERYKHFLSDQDLTPDLVAAAYAGKAHNLYDIYQCVLALKAFKNDIHATSLAQAHKRLRKILAQNLALVTDNTTFNPKLCHHAAEIALADQITQLQTQFVTTHNYVAMLQELLVLVPMITNFFQHVLVISADHSQSTNRLLLLQQLNQLLLTVADLTYLNF